MHRIESRQNPKFQVWLSLQESRGIKKAERFLLAGRKLVPEALQKFGDRFEAVLTDDEFALRDLAVPATVTPFLLERSLFRSLDEFGTGFPLLVGRTPALPQATLQSAPDGLELICALSDPANLGALMRSAAAFGVSRLVLLRDSAHPFHPKCLRAAANAVFVLRIETGESWPDLGTAHGPIYGLDGKGRDLRTVDLPRNVRLILGEEGKGLPGDLPVERLAIPTMGVIDSLNATIAASIALYAYHAAHSHR